MELDLETFLITLYVITMTGTKKSSWPSCRRVAGRRPSYATAKCCAWRWPPSGAAACLGRPNGLCALCLEAFAAVLSGMTSQSAFNRRVRRLWGAFILLQMAISEHWRTVADCEVLDCVPVRWRMAHGPSIPAG